MLKSDRNQGCAPHKTVGAAGVMQKMLKCKVEWQHSTDASPSHHSQGLMLQRGEGGGFKENSWGFFFVSSTVKCAKYYAFVSQQKGQPFFLNLILSLLFLLNGNWVSTLSVNTRTHMYSQSCCLIFFVSTQPFSFPMCPPLIFLLHSCVSRFFPPVSISKPRSGTFLLPGRTNRLILTGM